MAKDYVKVGGMVTFKPSEKAPDFVLGTIAVSINDFLQFCKDNPEYLTEYKGTKQLRITVTNGQYGLGLNVDTWKPSGQSQSEESKEEEKPSGKKGNSKPSVNDDDLPF